MTREQLAGLGLGRRAIQHRVEAGRLIRLHRGVWAVGHVAITPRSRWLAAVAGCGPGAVLSHRSAAALWRIRPAAGSVIDVTAFHHRAPRNGVRMHQLSVAPEERTVRDGIPVTTPARTLFDLAAVVAAPALERAAAEAEALRLPDSSSLGAVLERHRGRTGAPAVRALLAGRALDAGITRSELEDRFLEFLDAHGLPRPRLNQALWIGGRAIEADCVWPERRLIVELDGRAYHDAAAAFERDRERDRALLARGWGTVRITWGHLHGQAPGTARDLRRLLASP